MTGTTEYPRPIATWAVSLTCICPACDELVDLLDYPDFWDGRMLSVCENCTKRSHNVEVICPKCAHEFEVDLEY